ncbi:MAG: hypothetical protein K2H85_10380, partial [Allobaculum sp.]|nr:hypothetical protein [Allobaculum sp.]
MKKQFVKGLLATALTLLALGGCTESEDSSTTSKSSTSTTLNSSKSSSLKEENIKDSSNTSATTVTPLSAKSWIEQFKLTPDYRRLTEK